MTKEELLKKFNKKFGYLENSSWMTFMNFKVFISQAIDATENRVAKEFSEGKRCLNCGKIKENKLSDWCIKCLEEE